MLSAMHLFYILLLFAVAAPQQSPQTTVGQYAKMAATQKRSVVEACVRYSKAALEEEVCKTTSDVLDKRQIQSW